MRQFIYTNGDSEAHINANVRTTSLTIWSLRLVFCWNSS
jgi:hypothetical protein